MWAVSVPLRGLCKLKLTTVDEAVQSANVSVPLRGLCKLKLSLLAKLMTILTYVSVPLRGLCKLKLNLCISASTTIFSFSPLAGIMQIET